jgi:hypothetical protein
VRPGAKREAFVASSLHARRRDQQFCAEGRRVTLQIVCVRAEGEVRIELHGRLSGPEVAEFQQTCADQPPPLRIELENLSGASADGILALKEQRARGARLTGASPYIDLLLRGRSGTGGPGDGSNAAT